MSTNMLAPMTIILLVILLCDQEFKQSVVPIYTFATNRKECGWLGTSLKVTDYTAHKEVSV